MTDGNGFNEYRRLIEFRFDQLDKKFDAIESKGEARHEALSSQLQMLLKDHAERRVRWKTVVWISTAIYMALTVAGKVVLAAVKFL